jgi:uncharacterized protein YbjT (DUF2867 family)
VKTALVAGASGLVGGYLLRELLEHPAYGKITALVRRGLPVSHPKLLQREITFDLLAEAGTVARAEQADVFCCLGTTLRKAGSRAAFRRVDHDYVRDLAAATSRAGARQFLLVSSSGANPGSRVFYSRVKGDAETAVRAVQFRSVHIFRPSLLLGERAELRPAERVGIVVARAVAPLLVGPLRPYRPIHAATVARAMVRVALQDEPGVHLYRSDVVERLGA